MRGTPQIEVTFDIDANGVLSVSAKDRGTGKQNQIRIEGSSGMSQDEIERMRKDADSHADEDKQKKDLIDARNEADSKVYQLEKLLRENGEKIKDADKAPIQSAIEKVKQTQGGEDVAALRRAIGDLDQAAHAMSQHLYQQGGPGGPDESGGGVRNTPPGGSPNGSDGTTRKDDVIDAEFEVKK